MILDVLKFIQKRVMVLRTERLILQHTLYLLLIACFYIFCKSQIIFNLFSYKDIHIKHQPVG